MRPEINRRILPKAGGKSGLRSAGTSITPNPATILFSLDYDIVVPDVEGATAGLALISSNFDPGTLGYTFNSGSRQLRVFGLPNAFLTAGTNDFDAIILIADVFFNGASLASVQQFIFTQVGTNSTIVGSAPTLSVQEVGASPVPLPGALVTMASAFLLAFGGAAASKKRSRRAVFRPEYDACAIGGQSV